MQVFIKPTRVTNDVKLGHLRLDYKYFLEEITTLLNKLNQQPGKNKK